MFSILFWTKCVFVNLFKIKVVFGGLFLLSTCILPIAKGRESNSFLNTYQVNISGGWFSSGDYKREYQNYKRYTVDDLKYESYKGLAQNKSVIVLLVESLSCSVTHLCGNQNDYMPNLKQFAYDNVYFPNYYSNNLHTNGAIFTITTGFPLVSGRSMKDVLLNESFYFNDVVNKFHKNGYVTSYYSPAKFVLAKDKQLVLSEYDVLSSSNDKYYDDFDKPGVFGSVSDENMFDKIIFDLKKIKNKPVFIMLTTVSTHTPYITPWGANNIETAFNRQGAMYAYASLMLFLHTGLVRMCVQLKGSSGLRMRERRISADMRPISMLGICTVVKAGSTRADWKVPSKPVTMTWSGMETPFRLSAFIRWMAR